MVFRSKSKRLRSATAALLVAACAALALGAASTWSAFSSSTANAGSYFETQSTFGGSCTNNTSTPIYVTGVENGRVSNLGAMSWSSITGAMSADSTVSRTGTYSLRAAPAAATAYVQKLMVTNAVAYPATAVARFAVRLGSPPSGDAELFRFQAMTNDGSVQLRYIAATQKLAMSIRGSLSGTPAVVESSSAVSAGTWYVIDVRYAVGGTTHSVDWRVAGTAQTTASVAGPADTVDSAYFGTGGTATTYTVQYDDIILTGGSGDYPFGPGGVHLLKPDGMGTSVGAANFQEEDGTAIDANTWTRLDDVPATSTADFIRQSTSSGTSYVELTFENTPHTCIRAVWGRALWHFNGTNQANIAELRVYDGTRSNLIRGGSWNSNIDTLSRQQTEVVQPLSAPWTQSAVNGLVGRFGYSTDVAPPPQLDALLLEYEAAE